MGPDGDGRDRLTTEGGDLAEQDSWMDIDTSPGQPQPPEWLPVVLGVARDRSADSWKFTSIADVREALTERQLLGAVQAEGPTATPDCIRARILVNPNGQVATWPDPHGPIEPGPRIEEIISGMAHEMKAVIVLDDQLAIGTAGVPLEQIPEHVLVTNPDRRRVYCWPGNDEYTAQAAATGLQEPVTLHPIEGWTVLASPFETTRVLQGLNAATERYPFVALIRVGPERRVEYVMGRGKDDLRLMAAWWPGLDPLVGADQVNPKDLDPQGRDLQAMLCHPRFGEDEMQSHPGLAEDVRAALSAALTVEDGADFMPAVGAALDLPPIAIRLIEQDPGDEDPDLVGEPVQTASRLQLARTMMKDATREGREPTPMERKVERWVPIIELVAGLFFLAAALLDFLPGPWWIWTALGVLLTGDAIHSFISDARDKRKNGQKTAGE